MTKNRVDWLRAFSLTDESERLMDYVSSIAALNRVVRQLSQSLMVDKKMALKVISNNRISIDSPTRPHSGLDRSAPDFKSRHSRVSFFSFSFSFYHFLLFLFYFLALEIWLQSIDSLVIPDRSVSTYLVYGSLYFVVVAVVIIVVYLPVLQPDG